MSIFYKATPKELLELRNKIFLERGVPALERNSFVPSPFITSWFGRNNLKDFTYELCRISKESQLNMIITHISKRDRWVKLFLNVFQLSPHITSVDQLKGIDGRKFCLPPNSISEMRLRADDFRGIPLFNFTHHQLGRYFTKNGLEERTQELGDLIEKDMTEIDRFIKRWHELHKPNVTDWNGNPIKPD